MTVYGVHTGLQNTTVAELGTLWGRIEDLGFGWISIWFTLTDARNEPRPVQSELPVWIGGGGEKRTLRIAARFADGWNVPFVAPETFAAKRDVLHRHCDELGRDPGKIRCAVNLGIAWSEDSLVEQFGGLAERVRPGVLGGSDDEMLERIGSYVEAGADQVNVALRARTGDGPTWDVDALERLAGALGLRP